MDGAVHFPENTSTLANAKSPEEEATNRALEDSFKRANEALTNTDTAVAIANTITTAANQLPDTTNTGEKPRQPTSSRISLDQKHHSILKLNTKTTVKIQTANPNISTHQITLTK